MITETRLPVRYAETDQMGIVHHSVYAVWFECGRTEHIRTFGLTYDGMEKMGAMLPLLKLTCGFHRPMFYGETAIVKTRLIKAGKTRVVLDILCTRRRMGRHAPPGPPNMHGQTRH